jgi:hypothetical protein
MTSLNDDKFSLLKKYQFVTLRRRELKKTPKEKYIKLKDRCL